MRLARAIKQPLDLRLLIPDDEPRGKYAVAVLFFGRSSCRTGYQIRKKSSVGRNVVDPAEAILQLHQG